MERLLWTPDQIADAQIIPYCAEEIRRLVRRGEIPAVRRQGRRILIHYADLEVYANRFRSGHTDAAGPHASGEERDVCRERRKKVSTKGTTRRTTGRPSSTDAGSELGALLGFK